MPMRIMVVDDEQPILDLIKASIVGPEYEVRPFLDSREAAEVLKREKFDGVFADVRMPDLDGFELTKLVRCSPLNGSIPVVLTSGLNDAHAMQKAFRAGANGFLGKPFGPKELFGLLRAMRDPLAREKRVNGRLPFLATLACQLDCEGGDRFEATSLSLSEGGMLLRSLKNLEIAQKVVMQFVLPNGTAIKNARAMVIRKDAEARISVVFTSILANDREGIKRLIAAEASAAD